jgi:hypothetical protein
MNHSIKFALDKVGVAVVCAGIVYLLAYAVLAVRGCPAVDKNAVIKFRTTVYGHYAPARLNGVSMYAGESCIWNYVFEPLGIAFYSFFRQTFESANL